MVNLYLVMWEPQLRRWEGLGCLEGWAQLGPVTRPLSDLSTWPWLFPLWWPGPERKQNKKAGLDVRYKIALPGLYHKVTAVSPPGSLSAAPEGDQVL